MHSVNFFYEINLFKYIFCVVYCTGKSSGIYNESDAKKFSPIIWDTIRLFDKITNRNIYDTKRSRRILGYKKIEIILKEVGLELFLHLENEKGTECNIDVIFQSILEGRSLKKMPIFLSQGILEIKNMTDRKIKSQLESKKYLSVERVSYLIALHDVLINNAIIISEKNESISTYFNKYVFELLKKYIYENKKVYSSLMKDIIGLGRNYKIDDKVFTAPERFTLNNKDTNNFIFFICNLNQVGYPHTSLTLFLNKKKIISYKRKYLLESLGKKGGDYYQCFLEKIEDFFEKNKNIQLNNAGTRHPGVIEAIKAEFF